MDDVESQLKALGAVELNADEEAILRGAGATPVEDAPPMLMGRPETGQGEAFVRGAAQGATLGFADEITGGLGAAYDVATTDKSMSDLLDLYRQRRDESRAEYKANEEDYWKTSMAGNLAGGILPGLATGGAGLGMKGALALGAGSGAVSGLGMSEEESLGGMAQDAALGGAVGGLVGGAVKIGADKFGDDILKAGVSIKDLGGKAMKAVADIEPLHDFVASAKQGLKGRRLVGKKADEALKMEAIGLVDGLDDSLSTTKNAAQVLQDDLISNAGPIPMREFYDEAMAGISRMDRKYGKNPAVADDLQKVKEGIDNYVLGRTQKLEVPTIQQIGLDEADESALQKIYDTVARKNATHEVQQELVSDKLMKGKRTWDSVGGVDPDEDIIIPNKFAKPGKEENISILTKDGKMMKAQHIEPITDKEGNIVGHKGLQGGPAGVLESATQYLDEQFILSALPYKTRTVQTKSMGPVVQIIDESTNKPVGKPYSLAQLTKPKEIIEALENQKVSVKMDGGAGENMELPAIEVQRMKQMLGKMGSAGDEALPTGDARMTVNRLLTSHNPDRPMSSVEKAIELPETFNPLDTLLEKHIPGLDEANSAIHHTMNAQAEVPNLNQILGSDSTGRAATSSYAAVKKFLDKLPDSNPATKALKDKIAPGIRDIAEAQHIRDKIAAPGLGHGITDILGGTIKGVFYGGSNVAGASTRALYDHATPEFLKSLSQTVLKSGSKAAQSLSNVLSQAAGRDQMGRRALLFAIQQNPEYREMIRAATGEPEDKNKK